MTIESIFINGAVFRPPSRTKTWRFDSTYAHRAQTSRFELMRFLEYSAAPGSDMFACELILGELLANTVEHAPGLVHIFIDWTSYHPVVRLRDSGPGLVEQLNTLPEGEYSENGRGLALIRSLSPSFVIEPQDGRGMRCTVILPISRKCDIPNLPLAG